MNETQHCVDCKHYRYVEREGDVELAHKNRCTKFHEKHQPVALVRSGNGPCGEHGGRWEK